MSTTGEGEYDLSLILLLCVGIFYDRDFFPFFKKGVLTFATLPGNSEKFEYHCYFLKTPTFLHERWKYYKSGK